MPAHGLEHEHETCLGTIYGASTSNAIPMRRTVTHVGRSDLSEEQWLAVALRYSVQVLAPRPATSEEQCALPL